MEPATDVGGSGVTEAKAETAGDRERDRVAASAAHIARKAGLPTALPASPPATNAEDTDFKACLPDTARCGERERMVFHHALDSMREFGVRAMEPLVLAQKRELWLTSGGAQVRRANCGKNTGKTAFAFNALQIRMLPRLYRPPRSACGSNVS